MGVDNSIVDIKIIKYYSKIINKSLIYDHHNQNQEASS